MIVELVIGAVAFAAGAKTAWRMSRGDKNRCRACTLGAVKYPRCREQAYEYCESGFCMVHCREDRRCNGMCITERQRMLKNV